METEDFYCDFVLSGKIEVGKVCETANVLAYYHTKPFWETHIVVITKKHIASIFEVEEEDQPLIFELFEVIRKVADSVVAEKGAARILSNTGEYQESKHLHIHVNSGERIRF
jgi:histidine triad (HIT) family protein